MRDEVQQQGHVLAGIIDTKLLEGLDSDGHRQVDGVGDDGDDSLGAVPGRVS